MTESEVIKILLGGYAVAGSVIAFLFYRVEKVREDRDALHEAHKQEMRDNGKTMLQMTQQLTQAIERLNDLEERRRQ